MKATASSGLAPVYRILKGQEFATIEDGNILNLHTLPEHAEIVVEAFQPGDREWETYHNYYLYIPLFQGLCGAEGCTGRVGRRSGIGRTDCLW